ncbi:hypothetical protein M9458_051888, partial [Cirrhinus mrigala]
IVRKASQNPRLTARSLQKDLADTGVVVHYSTIKRYLYKYEENLFYVLTTKIS